MRIIYIGDDDVTKPLRQVVTPEPGSRVEVDGVSYLVTHTTICTTTVEEADGSTCDMFIYLTKEGDDAHIHKDQR